MSLPECLLEAFSFYFYYLKLSGVVWKYEVFVFVMRQFLLALVKMKLCYYVGQNL